MKIHENKKCKILVSENYNYVFDKENGFFARWGKTPDDDPQFSPYGPEIADIEVTTQCRGINGKLCKFCYKANTPVGCNMSFETFKKIFDVLPKTLTQIAFGVDSEAKSNPDLWKMMEYSRQKGVIPNTTVANIDDETAKLLCTYCGAVAVSRYDDKNICYDSVKRLTDLGMKQVNIHIMISEETFEQAKETLRDRITDERLKDLNAIVFLSLKKKGRAQQNFNTLSKEKFKQLIDFAFENNISIGFDSCGANKVLEVTKERPNYAQIEQCAEPCESTCFSVYCNAEGIFYPCSFCEEEGEWKEGIDLTKVSDFMSDVWMSEKVMEFRRKLIEKKRNCPVFDV